MIRNRLARRLFQRMVDDRVVFGETRFRTPLLQTLAVEDSEPWMREVLSALLRVRHGLLLDVGANLGQTMLAFRSLTRDAPYVGVEPNPACAAYVNALIKLNHLERCTVVPVAMARSSEILKLEFYQDHAGDSSASIVPFFRDDRPVVASQLVPAFTGADFRTVVDMSGLALIKIDAEGAEPDILETLTPEIAAHRPLMIFELLPAYSEANTRRVEMQDRVSDLLKAHAYKIYRTIKTPRNSLKGFRPIDAFGIHQDLALTDYVALPAETVDKGEVTWAQLLLPKNPE